MKTHTRSMLGTLMQLVVTDDRDHAELPDDFEERAAEIEDNHRANPVKEELRGMSVLDA